jgi:hypothetical protein
MDEVAAPTGGGPGAGLDIGATPVSSAVPGPAADHESTHENQGSPTPVADAPGDDVPLLERGQGGPFADGQAEVVPFPEGSGLELDAAGHAECDAYIEEELPGCGKTRLCARQEPEYVFQRAEVGDTEYEIAPQGAEPTWADGVDATTGLAQDAKYRAPGSKSSWLDPESLPSGLREKAGAKVDRSLEKYLLAIADPRNPIRGLEIVTNDRAVAVYWYGRMKHLGIPGRVRIDP